MVIGDKAETEGSVLASIRIKQMKHANGELIPLYL